MIRIFDIEWWREIFQSLGRNKKRSIFTSLGVIWGTFMLVLLLGIGMGISGIVMKQLGDSSRKISFISTEATSISYKGMPAGRWWDMQYKDLEEIRRIPGMKLAGAAGYSNWGGKMVCDGITYDISYTGYDVAFQEIDKIDMIAGRLLNDIDMKERRKVCLLSKRTAENILGNNDYQQALGKKVGIDGIYYTVVGVYEKGQSGFTFTSPHTVIAPYSTVDYLHNKGRSEIMMLGIMGERYADMKALESACRMVISEIHTVSPEDDKALMIFNTEELRRMVEGLFSGVIFLTWFVGAGTLLAGIIGITNIMLIIVRERRQEIGVRRALGAKPFEIVGQILAESSVLTLLAGILGMTAALLIQGALDRILLPIIFEDDINMAYNLGISLQLPFGTALLAFGIIFAGSLAAGALPAYKAIKISAVDALREE